MLILVALFYIFVIVGLYMVGKTTFIPHVCVFEITAENPGVPVALASHSTMRVVECSCKRRVIVGYGEVIPC